MTLVLWLLKGPVNVCAVVLHCLDLFGEARSALAIRLNEQHCYFSGLVLTNH